MAKIETLVADIYSLFDGDLKFDVELFKQFGINLEEGMDYRFHSERKDATLRMSNIGKPDRQLWYDLNWKGEVEGMPPHTMIKFTYGDILEQMMLLFAKMAGHDVQFEQGEISVNGIKGHLDAIIDGVVVDVKSASNFAFKKFAEGTLLEPGNDPFGYVGQLAGYVHAKTPGERGAFLAVNKETGKLALLVIPPEKLLEYDVPKRIEYVKEMVGSDVPPSRCYDDKPDGKSGNRILAVGCSYCKHKHHCWPGLKTYFYSNGPRFFTNVQKEPRVSSEFPD